MGASDRIRPRTQVKRTPTRRHQEREEFQQAHRHVHARSPSETIPWGRSVWRTVETEAVLACIMLSVRPHGIPTLICIPEAADGKGHRGGNRLLIHWSCLFQLDRVSAVAAADQGHGPVPIDRIGRRSLLVGSPQYVTDRELGYTASTIVRVVPPAQACGD